MTVARLRQVADLLDSGEPLPADLSAWLAGALRAYLDGARDGVTLDDCCGVSTQHGARPWWVIEDTAERDQLLRALAEQHSGEDAAHAIATAASRYVSGRWRFDRDRTPEDMEAISTDPERVLLHRALVKGGGRIPTSKKQIRRVLRDTRDAISCPGDRGPIAP